MAAARSRASILTVAGAWLLCAPGIGQAAEVNAGLHPDTIYLGTQAQLVVEVQDGDGQWPTAEGVDGVQISRYGSPRTVHQLFAGTARRLHSYNFLVSPERAGTFQIPAVTVKVGDETITRGPFALRVLEAAVKYIGFKLAADETVVGQPVALAVVFQGYRPGLQPSLPEIDGLTITPTGEPQTQLGSGSVPQVIFRYRVVASKLGTFRIKGITFAGVAAEEIVLTVSPFVVVGTGIDDQSLSVGQQTGLRVATLGLSPASAPAPVAPGGLSITAAGSPRREQAGTLVFNYSVTAMEPGNPTITHLKLADGRQFALKQPIALSVRQSGRGGILSCTAVPRSNETALGEPFIIDFDVFYRGDYRAAAVDLSKAAFADKPYIKVESVSDLSYPDWKGQPLEIGLLPEGKLTALAGSGDYQGQKEQRIRFALKITPLVAGELPMAGLRFVIRLHVSERQQGPGFVFQSTADQDYDSIVDLPPHRVVDPRGKKAPAGYRGAIGAAFTFVTSLDRTTAAAMSPLTLTMKITGESVGPQSQPPALAEVAELVRDFEVSPSVSGGEVDGNTITFTQTIRPRTEKVRELPALPLVFYNYEKQQYETAYSMPIPIEVRTGSLVGAQAMQTAVSSQPVVPATAVAAEPAASGAVLGANFDTLGSLVRREPLGPAGLLLVLIGGPASALLARFGCVCYLRRRPMSQIRRQRAGLMNSLDGLGAGERFHVELAGIVQEYLRLTLGLPPGEISGEELARLLDQRRAGNDLREAALNLLAECDAGRFAVGSVSGSKRDRLVRQAREVLRRIEDLTGN